MPTDADTTSTSAAPAAATAPPTSTSRPGDGAGTAASNDRSASPSRCAPPPSAPDVEGGRGRRDDGDDDGGVGSSSSSSAAASSSPAIPSRSFRAAGKLLRLSMFALRVAPIPARMLIRRLVALPSSSAPLPALRRGSSPGAVANLCSATLGAGALSLPYAFSRAGLVPGTVLLVVSALGTVVSVDVISEACDCTGLGGYESAAHRLCGRGWRTAAEVCIFAFCFGTAVAYVVAVGDVLDQGVIGTLSDVLPSFVTREFVMVLFWAAVMFPLSLCERIDSLRFASVVGIGSVGFLVAAAVAHSIRDMISGGGTGGGGSDNDGGGGGARLWPDSVRDVIRACPIVMFAFSCQVNVCAIYRELGSGDSTGEEEEDPSSPRPVAAVADPSRSGSMAAVTRVGVSICLAFYALMGLFGYMDFGERTRDNVLKNYCVHETRDPLMIAAFVCVTLAVVVAFPLNVFPARDALEGAWTRTRGGPAGGGYGAGGGGRADPLRDGGIAASSAEPPSPTSSFLVEPLLRPADAGGDVDGRDGDGYGYGYGYGEGDGDRDGRTPGLPPPPPPSRVRHVALTVLISGAALLAALAVPDISVVFGLVGGTASSVVGFVLPGMFAIEMNRDPDDGGGDGGSESGGRERWWGRFRGGALIVGGAAAGALSTSVTVYSAFVDDPAPGTCRGD